MPEEQKPKYRVEVERDGCPCCAHDRLWAVVHVEGGEDVQESENFGDQDQAEVLADRMNSAYELALKESAAPELLEALKALRIAVMESQMLNGRDYDQLGIQVNAAIANAEGRNA